MVTYKVITMVLRCLIPFLCYSYNPYPKEDSMIKGDREVNVDSEVIEQMVSKMIRDRSP